MGAISPPQRRGARGRGELVYALRPGPKAAGYQTEASRKESTRRTSGSFWLLARMCCHRFGRLTFIAGKGAGGDTGGDRGWRKDIQGAEAAAAVEDQYICPAILHIFHRVSPAQLR